MAAQLPYPPNATCDVYSGQAPPPAAPRLTGVAIFLDEKWTNIKTGTTYSHVARVALGTDVRDGDFLYVPNGSSGTQFQVTFVARTGRGTDLDHKVVYLNRTSTVPWPTDDL